MKIILWLLFWPFLIPYYLWKSYQKAKIRQVTADAGELARKLNNGNSNEIEGEIGCFGLQNWWLQTFSDRERNHIENVYQPMGSVNSHPLISGECTFEAMQTPLAMLTNLATWFDNPRDREIAIKIITKAEEYVDAERDNDILAVHFFYGNKMRLFYKLRKVDKKNLDIAIESAKSQISISKQAKAEFLKDKSLLSLPHHAGYLQLCIILDKQGEYNEAIKYAIQAKSEGWNADAEWDKRIAKYKKKLVSQKKGQK